MELPEKINFDAIRADDEKPGEPPERESPYARSDIRDPHQAAPLLATGELEAEPLILNSADDGPRKVWLTFDHSSGENYVYLPIILNWSGTPLRGDDWITIGVQKGAVLDTCGLWWEQCWQWATKGTQWNTGWTLYKLKLKGWDNTPQAVWFTWKESNRSWWGIERGGFR